MSWTQINKNKNKRSNTNISIILLCTSDIRGKTTGYVGQYVLFLYENIWFQTKQNLKCYPKFQALCNIPI